MHGIIFSELQKYTDKKLGAGLAIAVAASRVYLGVHYLSDVVAGLLWGAAWALAATSRGRA